MTYSSWSYCKNRHPFFFYPLEPFLTQLITGLCRDIWGTYFFFFFFRNRNHVRREINVILYFSKAANDSSRYCIGCFSSAVFSSSDGCVSETRFCSLESIQWNKACALFALFVVASCVRPMLFVFLGLKVNCVSWLVEGGDELGFVGIFGLLFLDNINSS